MNIYITSDNLAPTLFLLITLIPNLNPTPGSVPTYLNGVGGGGEVPNASPYGKGVRVFHVIRRDLQRNFVSGNEK